MANSTQPVAESDASRVSPTSHSNVNRSADITIDYNQDFAASDVDAVYGAAFLAGTLMYLDFKPTSSARGSTNPSYVYAAYVSDYSPLSNAVGDRAGVSVSFKVTGTYARLTS